MGLKITKITIKGFKKFKASNIKNFYAEFKKPFVIILGTNGSGKTSLIKELIPQAIPRTYYTEEGCKIIEIFKDDIRYVLFSDFKHKTKGYKFLKKMENLNTNGSMSLQEELIFKEFNLNPAIIKLLAGDIKFSIMTPSQRKEFLNNILPYDTSYLFDLVKSVQKVIRLLELKLKELTQSKIECESQLKQLKEKELTDDTITQLKQLKDKYIYILTTLTNMANTTIQSLPSNNLPLLSITSSTSLEPFKTTLTNLANEIKELFLTIRSKLFYAKLYTNPIFTKIAEKSLAFNEELQNYLHELKSKIELKIQHIEEEQQKNQEQQKQIVTSIDELQQTLEYQTTYIKDLTQKIQNLESHITQISNQLNESSIQPLPTTIEKQSTTTLLKTIKLILDNIFSIIQQYKGLFKYNHPLPKVETHLPIVSKHLAYLKDYLNTLSKEITQLKEVKNHLEQQLNSIKNPTIPCEDDTSLSSACTLYDNYTTTVSELKNELSRINKELDTKTKKLTQLSKSYKKLQTFYNYLFKLNKAYKDLKNTLTKTFSLSQALAILENHFTYTPNTFYLKPYEFYKYLEELINITALYHHQQQLSQQLNEYLTQYQTITSKIDKKLSVKALKYNLYKLQEQLQELKKAYDAYLNKKLYYESKFQDVQEFLSTVTKILELYNQLQEKINTFTQLASIIFYIIPLHEHYLKLYLSLEQSLKLLEEDHAKYQYLITYLEKDILPKISQLESDIQSIKNLYPYLVELYNIYYEHFIKDVLLILNNLLNKIFNYPILVIKTDDGNGYTFPIKLPNDTTISDIKEASTGQKDLIDFCFNLAILLKLGFIGYPLFLDEIDKALDHTHREKLLELLVYLINEGIVSQIFMASNTFFHQGFCDAQYIVLNESNIILPEKYNEHVEIERYE